jgi:hypothetical protein
MFLEQGIWDMGLRIVLPRIHDVSNQQPKDIKPTGDVPKHPNNGENFCRQQNNTQN